LENLSLIAKETSNGVIITDVNGNITWVNNAFTRISGYKIREVAGKKPGSFLQGPETDPATIRYLHERIANRQAFNCDIINYSKSRQRYWIHIQGEPIFDDAGQCIKFIVIQNEISDLINAQEKIRASEQNYRYLFNRNPMPMWIIDQETLYFLEANEAAQYHYGYSAAEFQQMKTTDINPKSAKDKLKSKAAERLYSPSSKDLGVRTHIKKNGESIFVEVTYHNIDYKGRKSVLVLANNVTEKIQLQDKLNKELILKQREITEAVVEAQEKERMEVGKELHDNVNQLLGAARLYITTLKDYKEDIDIMLDKSAGLVSSAIEEVRKLSKTLTGPGIENLRLCEAVESLVQQIEAARTISISFEKEIFYEEDLRKKLKLNIFRIVQEQFNNILKHANASEVFISLHRDAGKISLVIQDNGQGFDTFQTRNGIGITNIVNRASLNNGKVSIESAPGKGCRLEVKFRLDRTVAIQNNPEI
jgi:PAS domain S-box-containing protein